MDEIRNHEGTTSTKVQVRKHTNHEDTKSTKFWFKKQNSYDFLMVSRVSDLAVRRPNTMTEQRIIIKTNAGEFAEQRGNVAGTCRILRYSRDQCRSL